jgi:protein gp37
MGEQTNVSYAQHTFNGWWGCIPCSPGCAHCYARSWDARFGGDHWGVGSDRKLFTDRHWAQPLVWNRDAEAAGVPARVLCPSMGDAFEDHPQIVEPRARLWRVIEQTPWLQWVMPTKRPENVAGMVPWGHGGWPENLWLGVSVEDQQRANERIPILVSLPAAVRWVSAAPLLRLVDLSRWMPRPFELEQGGYELYPKGCDVHGNGKLWIPGPTIGWVVTEGESGPNARPSHPDWFRTIRDQCIAAGVPYHHKQWGEWAPVGPLYEQDDDQGEADDARMDAVYLEVHKRRRVVQLERYGTIADGYQPTDPRTWLMARVGKKAAGRELDGRLWDQYPTSVDSSAAASPTQGGSR